ncbi:MBL fold metallo-hydrolase [Algoriphagus sp. AK58]|uniref:MBL fold metallo-hydrolase n=1 Tax=Algoriphagus sp. AK58 TaxID=1406877 RepID=UPI00164F3C72|nr:MBL fold metallo-hydrolase [Algoriphagus sp. AK58]MBC6369126.1 MBL fold metallo-hydrolase [Algoriphagus sp. AK58]
MKIKLLGAAGGEVTGSCYLVRTEKSAILIDCGMFQGGRDSEAKNLLPEGAKPDQVQAVLLTHGHLDHTGRVPLLIKHGFRGQIFSTIQTLQLAQIILQDSARLQEADAERQNRKHWEPGQPLMEPLYSPEHVEFMKELNQEVPFGEPIRITEDITARWIEAGHMLGSGSIELTVLEDGRKKVIAFSGDLGPLTMPLLRPFEHFHHADLVFMESTYGDRIHKSYDETVEEFERIVKEVSETGGKVLIPTFAIGRAQQLIYHMAEFYNTGRVKPFPVYLDSPMAIRATDVYRNHQDLLDEEFHMLKQKGAFPVDENYFITSESGESSKALNEVKGPCMILAGAGMCNGGRILHHLRHNLKDPNTHVVIVGFQSQGSLGRKLVEKAETVRIFGEEIPVKAKVHTLNGFSAHAGQNDLLEWFSHLAPSKPKVALVHGEDGPRVILSELIEKKFGIKPLLPEIGDLIEI